MMTTGGMVDLLELSRHLKQERLFVNAEKEQLQHLHSSVGNSAQKTVPLVLDRAAAKMLAQQLDPG